MEQLAKPPPLQRGAQAGEQPLASGVPGQSGRGQRQPPGQEELPWRPDDQRPERVSRPCTPIRTPRPVETCARPERHSAVEGTIESSDHQFTELFQQNCCRLSPFPMTYWTPPSFLCGPNRLHICPAKRTMFGALSDQGVVEAFLQLFFATVIDCLGLIGCLGEHGVPESRCSVVDTTACRERALLTYLLARLRALDADVYVGHNIAGFDVDVLLHRMQHHKVTRSTANS
eukprot:scaffold146937_cov44-Prasinocladus_malaysianus.AAC.1